MISVNKAPKVILWKKWEISRHISITGPVSYVHLTLFELSPEKKLREKGSKSPQRKAIPLPVLFAARAHL